MRASRWWCSRPSPRSWWRPRRSPCLATGLTRWTRVGWLAGSSEGPTRCASRSSRTSGTAQRNSLCAGRFRSASRSSRCCWCLGRRSLASNGASPTIGCCRSPCRRARSVTSCAATSPSTLRATSSWSFRTPRGSRQPNSTATRRRCRRCPRCRRCLPRGGTFVGGRPAGPPSAATGLKDGSAFLTVGSTAPLFTDASETQLDRLRAVSPPAGQQVRLTGVAQINRDSSESITSRLPTVLGIIAAITFVLLFLLTGSVVLPLKALVLNVLSLTAAFGALVWIFQDGHLGAFGTTPTGTLVANMPVLLFCVAFGLSMDYEVFLISRIREYWLQAGAAGPATSDRVRTRADNDESVALGLARTGRVVTAAAMLMAISFAALIAAQVAFMRMFGVGLPLAVLVDATLVRMLLVPAFMHLLGRANWWAPKPLARLHERFGISEESKPDHAEPVVTGSG